MRKLFVWIAPLAVTGVMATAAYGFMAANQVEDHRAGFGSGNVSGYTVTGEYFAWFFDANNSAQVYNFSFYISPVPTYQVGADLAGRPMFWSNPNIGGPEDCTLQKVSDTLAFVSCPLSPPIPMASITSINVAAQDAP